MTILTVLCMTLTAFGNINATLGVACALRKRGHKVVFITERSFKGFFEKEGFEEQIFDESEQKNAEQKGKEWREWAEKNFHHLGSSKIESNEMFEEALLKLIDDSIYANPKIEEIVQTVKPDVIIEDRYFIPLPAFVSSGIPIVKITTCNPLYSDWGENLPPAFFHLPTNNKSKWEIFRKVVKESRRKLFVKVLDYYKLLREQNSINYDVILSKKDVREYRSTNLNILVYPKSLMADYLRLQPLPPKFMVTEHSIRDSNDTFILPDKLKTGPGKLIYFSFGTVNNNIIELIEKFVDILGGINHRFIASLGQSCLSYKLPDNVWATPFVPQLKVLEMVDLVLTHGGNNTFVETLYYGKPMIVFPLVLDQFDNAQRCKEMKLGFSFNPFTVTENELKTSIDLLLNDEELHKRLTATSKEMQESESMEKVVNQIEFVAENPTLPSIQ